MRNKEDWDWSHFDEWMRRAFPFLQEDLRLETFMQKPQAIGKLVQEALDRSFNGSFVTGKAAISHHVRHDLFETHRSLIARVHLPQGAAGQTRTLLNRHCLRIEWPPDGKREIALHKPVNPRRSRARVKDGVLEVQMPKLRQTSDFYEL